MPGRKPNPADEEEEDHLQPHDRDRAKESQILLWTWNCLDEVAKTDYDLYLRDGSVLCRLMNCIQEGSIKGDIKIDSNKEKKKNIERFLAAATKYGVPKKLAFEPDDLMFLRHVPKVTRFIFALGKLVEEDEDYDGPELGQEPYEPVGKSGRRRGCLPQGDDIYVAHIKIQGITDQLLKPPEVEKKRVTLYSF